MEREPHNKRELRANWIFLGLFLLVMGPGLAMLTIKSYNKGKGAAGMSPPAPKTLISYIDPNPQNPSLPRAVPPDLRGFVETIATRMAKLQSHLVRAKDQANQLPRMSEARSLELVSMGATESTYSVAVIGWNKRLIPIPDLYTFEAFRDGKSTPMKMEAYEQLNLPLECRTELQEYMCIIPPDSALWMILTVPGNEPIDSITMRFKVNGKIFDDRLVLPAATATTQPRQTVP